MSMKARRVFWNAILAMVVLQQSVAGYAGSTHVDVSERLAVPTPPTATSQAERRQQVREQAETTIAELNAEVETRLGQRVRESFREQLAAAAPNPAAKQTRVAQTSATLEITS